MCYDVKSFLQNKVVAVISTLYPLPPLHCLPLRNAALCAPAVGAVGGWGEGEGGVIQSSKGKV